MIWMMFFAAVLLLCFMIVKWNNLYTMAFFASAASFIMLIFSFAIYANIVYSYEYSGSLDYIMYRFFRNLNVSFYNIKNIVNAAIAIYGTAVLFICIKTDIRIRSRYVIISNIIIYLVFLLCILYFNSDKFAEKIFLLSYTDESTLYAQKLRMTVTQINHAVMLVWILMPCIKLLVSFYSTCLRFRRRYYIMIMTTHLIFSAGIVLMLYISPLNFFYNNYDLYDFAAIYMHEAYERNYVYICVLLCLMIVAMLYLIHSNAVEKKRSFEKYLHRYEKNIKTSHLRHVFHTYKNAMFSIIATSNMALSADNTDDIKFLVRKIKKCAQGYANHVSVFLNINQNLNSLYSNIGIANLIVEAESLLSVPSGIKVIKNINTQEDVIWGCKQDIILVFQNLLQNSIEAIVKKGTGGEIIVNVYNDGMYICADVEDNGTGISKKDIKNIFVPFYTTNQSSKNWGLGLSHVKSIIDLHGGHIDVMSREGSYTKFQIALPLSTKKVGDDYCD